MLLIKLVHYLVNRLLLLRNKRLHNLCTYYFESRQANRNYDRIIDILCSDRLKQTLPHECLNYVIDKDVELTTTIDNCHLNDNFSIHHKNYNHLSISKHRFRPSYDTRNTFM